MRCLILGATGQIGSYLSAACADRGLAHLGTGYRTPRPEFVPLDVRDEDGVSELLADYQPDVTFLAAGPAADDPADDLRGVLAGGAATVAAAVARFGGRLVLFSADDVFGDCPTARSEADTLTPATEYGRCKAAAEAAVRAALPGRHLIMRTGWVFGPGLPSGPAGQLIRRVAAGLDVGAATDRHGQPTYGPDVAEVALELARLGETGTVHAVGPDRHTEFTFARLAAHLLGTDVDRVEGRPAAEFGLRPRRGWLDRFKLRTLLGPRAIRAAGDGLRAVRAGLRAAPACHSRAA